MIFPFYRWGHSPRGEVTCTRVHTVGDSAWVWDTDLALSSPRTVGHTLCQQMELTICPASLFSSHTVLEILNRQLMDQWPEVGPTCVVFKNWEHGERPVRCAWAALSLGASAHLVHCPPQASCLAPLTVDLVTRPACWVAPVLPSSTLFSVLSVVCPLSFPQFQRLAILSIQDQVNKTTFADSFLF